MPEPLTTLKNLGNGPDRAFVLFASPEMRCLGIATKMQDYRANQVVILRISDEPNAEREQRIAELKQLLKHVGPIEVVDTRHGDPLVGLERLARLLRAAGGNGEVAIDISTFPKNSLLLALRTIERTEGVSSLRVLYSEAKEYKLRPPGTPIYGLRSIGIVPTFGASYQPNEELLLIMLLGYERDRAVAMWQRVQPHRTIAAISRPSFRPEWDGVAERVNAPLLAAIGEEGVHDVDPHDPMATHRFLKDVVVRASADARENYYVAPLGTKPQTVGVYLFCREYPDLASVVYGSPVAREHEYLAVDVGPAWALTRLDIQNA